MKPRWAISLLIIFLSASIIYSTPSRYNNVTAHAATTAGLGIWNDQYGSNLTSLTGLGIGTTFTVKVNVTNAGQLGGFKVTVGYFLVIGPAILQETSDSFSPGLFDGTGLAPGCTVIPSSPNKNPGFGQVEYSAVLQGSITGTGQPCTRPGNGTLFTMTFKVLTVGATAIDIIQTTNQGKLSSTILSPAPGVASIPYQPYGAYFRNAPGVPPVPIFTWSPSVPLVGSTVVFKGNQSYDPEAKSTPHHGLETEPIVYDSDGNGHYDSGEPVIVGATPSAGTPTCLAGSSGNCLKFDSRITYVPTGGATNWVQGDSVVYDSTQDGIYHGADFVIAGPQVPANTALKTDPRLVFDEIHGKYFWDNGYIWDFGDGQGQVTGNSTLHEFISQTTQAAAGIFSVRLAVYDADDHLPQRSIQVITVSTGDVFDVAVSVILIKDTLNVGQAEDVNVTVSNKGNKDFKANLTVTYDYKAAPQVGFEPIIELAHGQKLTFSYTIQTGPLAAQVYTVTGVSKLINATKADPTPLDDGDAKSFTLIGATSAALLSIPLLAGGLIAVAVVAYAAVYFVRRRRARAEE